MINLFCFVLVMLTSGVTSILFEDGLLEKGTWLKGIRILKLAKRRKIFCIHQKDS